MSNHLEQVVVDGRGPAIALRRLVQIDGNPVAVRINLAAPPSVRINAGAHVGVGSLSPVRIDGDDVASRVSLVTPTSVRIGASAHVGSLARSPMRMAMMTRLSAPSMPSTSPRMTMTRGDIA